MKLSWTQDQDPYSEEFQDRYYADEDGLAESRYVFLKQNRIEERLKTQDQVVIGELGFGTGLNFFATWDLWKSFSSAKKPVLHFVSFEKHPLSPEQIRTALARWPELESYVSDFLTKYSIFPPGVYRLIFENHQIHLTLFIGDATETLPELKAEIDAWYLDGFAPRKNPELWSETIFKYCADLSHSETSFSTYTAAGWVKRGLISAGFHCEKFEGFGRKREMIKGKSISSRVRSAINFQQKIAVVGAGLAGTFIAHALRSRGFNVTQFSKTGGKASDHRAALTMPVLSAKPSLLSHLSLSGLYFLRNFSLTSKPLGLVQLLADERKSIQWIKALDSLNLPTENFRLLSSSEASEIAGATLKHQGIYITEASVIDIQKTCEEMNAHHKIQYQNIISIQKQSDGIHLNFEKESPTDAFDIVILANAHSIKSLIDIPLRTVRGQIAYLKPNSDFDKIKTSICFDGFLSPTIHSQEFILGATYAPDSNNSDISPEDNKLLLSKLNSAISLKQTPEIASNWVEFRTSVAGQEPVVGKYSENIFISTAFGSRGTIYAPLSAQIITSLIANEPLPIERKFLSQLSPTRFS